MQLPTRTRRKRSFDGPLGVSSVRKWVDLVRKRQFLWVCVACLSLMLIHALLSPETRVFEAAVGRLQSPKTLSLHGHDGQLLDGTKTARSLPAVYPNGATNRFACDLPALRYQCDLDGKTGCRAYPQLFPAGKVMTNWSPNDIRMPHESYSSVCRFNISSPYEFALARVFHEMEVPFIAYGIPELTETTAKWTDDYLVEQLGVENEFKVQVSDTTHFMFFTRRMATENQAPTFETQWLRYADFLAKTADKTDPRYFYFMLRADDIRKRASFVLRDLAFLDPNGTAAYGDFFIRDQEFARNKVMRCRFGMPGIITEGHVDAGLNMVAMVRGRKRYILSPPSACSCLSLHTSGPSVRHTSLDWATVVNRETQASHYDCPTTEAVVREGDVLYIPSYWYHHIVSLDHTIQCNVRSGIIARAEVKQFLLDCGLAGF